jgi:two-component system, NtrC family, nitrogen regulation sensor histidine kinase NtrY
LLRTIYPLLVAITCFLAGLFAVHLYRQPVTPSVAARQITQNLNDEVANVLKAVDDFEEGGGCGGTIQTDYPIYVYRGDVLHCWTDNKILPPFGQLADTTSIQLLKIARSNFLMYQRKADSNQRIVALLLLTRDYPIQNDYLDDEWNRLIFPTRSITLLEPSSNLGSPIIINGRTVFRVSFLISGLSAFPTANGWAVMLIFISIIFFLFFLYTWLKQRYSVMVTLSVVSIWMIVIRLIMLMAQFPRSQLRTEIFSPTEFASSALNPSLGDLLLNIIVILIISICLFVGYGTIPPEKRRLGKQSLSIVVCTTFAFLVFAVFHFPSLTLQTIVHNSNLDLNITSAISFSTMRLMALLALVMAWCTAFLLAHVLLHFIFLNGGRNVHRLLLTGAIIFSGINYAEGQQFIHSLLISWVIIFIVHYFKLQESPVPLQYKTFTYIFVVLMGLVFSAGLSTYSLSKENNYRNQVRFAENFLVDRDAFGEFLLNDISQKIAKDPFVQARLASPFFSKEPIQQKIRQIFLPGYFNKYNISISMYSSSGTPLGATEESTFSDIIGYYESMAAKTEYSGLYYISDTEQNISQQYVLVTSVRRNKNLIGYIIIELSLKTIAPDNLYPELLIDNRFRQSLRPADLSYATFVNGVLKSSAGDFNYENDFDKRLLGNPDIHKQGIERGGYQHYAVEDASNAVTVISAPVMSVKFFLANVSFYLLSGLAVVLLLVLYLGFRAIIRQQSLYYAARIQLVINLSFFVPLVVVSVITLQLLRQSAQEQLNSTYQNRASFLAEQLSLFQGSPDSTRSTFTLKDKLSELSELSTTETVVYDSSGHLLATSQSSIFESQLQAPLVNPLALRLSRENISSFIVPDKIGSLSYFVSYAKVPSLHALLAVPYYQSADSLEKIRVTVFANIMTLFTLIFLALLAFSYFISQWLTYPLQFITQSLRQTALTKTNEPIRWKANDEIGLMAQSYNEMLQKLSDNKIELERMQREQAWREIAQQVAHEIKNPLTPMKLSLQRLDRSLSDNDLDTQNAKRAIGSMLEQVESLNSLAASFSSFAKMPTASWQEVDMVPLLKKVMDLYNQSDVIVWKNAPDQMITWGDPGMLQGVFSNIIINALQAKREAVDLRIEITSDKREKEWLITIQDNGKGIDPEKSGKIFLPHFTTKETGSGLGLAIARQSLEQMKGRIWFETVVNEGTRFMISMPLLLR